MSQPGDPLPPFIVDKPRKPPAGSAAELTAVYKRLQRRRQFFSIVGIVVGVLFYLFLRYVLPRLGRVEPRH